MVRTCSAGTGEVEYAWGGRRDRDASRYDRYGLALLHSLHTNKSDVTEGVDTPNVKLDGDGLHDPISVRESSARAAAPQVGRSCCPGNPLAGRSLLRPILCKTSSARQLGLVPARPVDAVRFKHALPPPRHLPSRCEVERSDARHITRQGRKLLPGRNCATLVVSGNGRFYLHIREVARQRPVYDEVPISASGAVLVVRRCSH